MTANSSISPELRDSIREVLGKNITLYQKCMVKHEVRPDKFEKKIIGLTGCRFFLFIAKTPTKVEQDFSFLDIRGVESKKKNQLTISVTDGKPLSFVTLEPESDDVDLMVTHIGRSLKNIFPNFPLERFVQKMEVQPPDRLKPMTDIMKETEKKEQGPCGGYSIMYACMCDYHSTPYREEVAWDVDTIYLSQDSRELNLQDFDHLSTKDLVPIIGALEHNTWFTKFRASKVKLSTEAQNEILKVMKHNSVIEELYLSNTGINVDFVQKLGSAILSNSTTQLQAVDLSKNSLDEKAMIHFIGSLGNLAKGLVHFDISNTRILGKGLNRVAESLLQNQNISQTLTQINISDNPSKGEELQSLYNFLAQANNITHLDLSGTDCALELLCAALLRGSCSTLIHLRLARNVFTHKKTKEVIVQGTWKQFFSSVYGLEILDMSGCRLPPEALKELLLGIACNIHVKNLHLDLSNNDLQTQGGQVLGSCIGNISSITSLDVSNNNLDQALVSFIEWIKSNKSIKHLAIGKNFDQIKPKHIPTVLESVVNLIQDESTGIESLSLADSKLKTNLADIINALGSNITLTEIDISGNQVGDFGARMLSKALQINSKLRTIIWDKNFTSAQGFEDIASALQKNYTLKKMPTPVNDVVNALQKQPERTELAIQKIESLLQRNHSPQKFSSDQAYRLQQGFLISSTQQMVDRLVVQVQDTVNALSLGSTDGYKSDLDQATCVIKDADNSKQLLPHLQHIAMKSLDVGNPVDSEVKNMAEDLGEALQTQIKKTVSDMIECTSNQCAGVTADKNFMSELVGGCSEKSSLPKGFSKHLFDSVETDIFNKLSELNLAVAAHISDTVIDGVIESLTQSHKVLSSHLKKKRSEGRPSIKDAKEKEEEKSETEESEKINLRVCIQADSPGSTPSLTNKRKSVHARKMRPPTVIDPAQVTKALQIHEAKDTDLDESNVKDTLEVPDCAQPVLSVVDVDISVSDTEVGSQEDLTAAIPNQKPEQEKVEIDSLGDLPDPSAKLTHIAKSRPRGPQRRRPTARPQENGKEASAGLKADEGLDAFFVTSASQVADSTKLQNTPSTPTSKPGKKTERKESMDHGSEKQKKEPPSKPTTEKPKKGWFSKGKDKDQAKEEKRSPFSIFGKKASTVNRSPSNSKDKEQQKPDTVVKQDEKAGSKENLTEKTIPEVAATEKPAEENASQPTEDSAPPNDLDEKKKEGEKEKEEKEEAKEEAPKTRRPPVGGVGIMGMGGMGGNLLSEMKSNKRFSVLNAEKAERKPQVALIPPGGLKKNVNNNATPKKDSPLEAVTETKSEDTKEKRTSKETKEVDTSVKEDKAEQTKTDSSVEETKLNSSETNSSENKVDSSETKPEVAENKADAAGTKTESVKTKVDTSGTKSEEPGTSVEEEKVQQREKTGETKPPEGRQSLLQTIQSKAKPSPTPRAAPRKQAEDASQPTRTAQRDRVLSSSSSSSSATSSRSSRSSSDMSKPSPPMRPKPPPKAPKPGSLRRSEDLISESKISSKTDADNEDSSTQRLSVSEKIKRLSQNSGDSVPLPTKEKSSSLPKTINKERVSSEIKENGEEEKSDQNGKEKSTDDKSLGCEDTSDKTKHSSDSDLSESQTESAIENKDEKTAKEAEEIMV